MSTALDGFLGATYRERFDNQPGGDGIRVRYLRLKGAEIGFRQSHRSFQKLTGESRRIQPKMSRPPDDRFDARNDAAGFDIEKSLGTVEKGKIADLVLLDANPLTDINNTRKIDAVIVGGKYLPKETLKKMLAEVEAVANKK